MNEPEPKRPLYITSRVDSYEVLDWSDVDILTDEEKKLPLYTTDRNAPASRRVTSRVDSYEVLDWSDVDVLTDEEKTWPLGIKRPRGPVEPPSPSAPE